MNTKDNENDLTTKKSDNILFKKKHDYQTDKNSGVLSKFYEGLIKYIFDKLQERGRNELYSSLGLQDKSEQALLEDLKNFFDGTEKLSSIELLRAKKNGYVLSGKYTENKENQLRKIFKEIPIVFKDICFPDLKEEQDKVNCYHKILSKLHGIRFINCEFRARRLKLIEQKIFFEGCIFLGEYSIYDSVELEFIENDINTIYSNCTFHENVDVRKTEYINQASDKFEENNTIKNTLFSACIFKGELRAKNIIFKNGIFDKNQFDNWLTRFKDTDNYTKEKKEFNTSEEYLKLKEQGCLDIPKLEFINCDVSKDFILNYFKIIECDFTDTTFSGKTKIQHTSFDKAVFYNTKFKQLADFYKTIFKVVDFERADFEEVTVFAEATFKENVDFKYVKFMQKVIFRDTLIKGELNLRNTIFYDDANFLDIRSIKDDKSSLIQVENRETARIIKSFYESSNNIIEANKFYALEMQKRREELGEELNNFFEWPIFKIHSLSSNHSQNWFLALFWIVSITLAYAQINLFYYIDNTHIFYVKIFPSATLFLFCLFIISVCFINVNKYIDTIRSLNIVILLSINYLLFNNLEYDCFTYNINLLSIFKNSENLSVYCQTLSNDIPLFALVYKLIMAYLIYQFIISIRQNTRRK